MKRMVRAPYRIFDNGGWSDTSFMPGGTGACCNVAISLYVHVDFEPNQSNRLEILHTATQKIETIDLPFTQTPHTLAQAAAKALKLEAGAGGKIVVTSDVPPGSGLGGSATYSVALLTALAPEYATRHHDVAALAQALETEWLGNSCGTQDQMGAAFGFVSFSEITYPSFTHEHLKLSDDFVKELEAELILVYTGASHFSSAMHHTVIERLNAGDEQTVQAFYDLKDCAYAAAEALKNEDMTAYKAALNKNWNAQKALHPGITTDDIEKIHSIATTIDANCAFKGSGAGGGGSVALLVAPSCKQQIVEKIKAEAPDMTVWDSLVIDRTGVTLVDAEEMPLAVAASTNGHDR